MEEESQIIRAATDIVLIMVPHRARKPVINGVAPMQPLLGTKVASRTKVTTIITTVGQGILIKDKEHHAPDGITAIAILAPTGSRRAIRDSVGSNGSVSLTALSER